MIKLFPSNLNAAQNMAQDLQKYKKAEFSPSDNLPNITRPTKQQENANHSEENNQSKPTQK